MDPIDEKLDEARFFQCAIKHYDALYVSRLASDHPRHNGVLDLMQAPSAELQALAKMVRFNFSAFLSAYRSVWSYIRERTTSVQAKPWLESVETVALFEALRLLRNIDVHQGTVATATRFRIGQVVDGGAGHLHVELANAAMSLSFDGLSELKQFRGRPRLAWLLADEPITTLSERSLTELVKIVAEGRGAGFY